jgi:hypothetical protein
VIGASLVDAGAWGILLGALGLTGVILYARGRRDKGDAIAAAAARARAAQLEAQAEGIRDAGAAGDDAAVQAASEAGFAARQSARKGKR